MDFKDDVVREVTMNDSKGDSASAQPVSVAHRLVSLNLDYLQMLLVEGSGSEQASEAEWITELACAPESRLHDIAQCSFSLFTACLHQAHLWRQVAAEADRGRTSRYAPALSRAPTRSVFLQCVLFYAWHLAQVDRGSARSTLGLSDEVAEILLSFELWQLRRAALEYPQLLAPRWAGNACFWPDLIQYARDGNRQFLDYARLLGTQLLAQDLEPSSIEHLTSLRQRVYRRPTTRR